jgi:ubiquinone/menaquinone biosynthesis C-methylase UbiE
MKNNYQAGTFDSRIISYENVHTITEEQKKEFLNAIDLKENEVVLDVCCGYGSATSWLTAEQTNANFYLSDASPVQLERAKQNLPEFCIFNLADANNLPYEDNFFDKVVLKMGLHENPFSKQQEITDELYRIIKPGGKLIIWELYLNEKNQIIFQDFIRKKDELCGFTKLVERRYFQRGDEIKSFLDKSGFVDFKEEFVFNPELHTKARFKEFVSREMKESDVEEMTEKIKEVAQSRLDRLNEFLRNLSDEQKEIINMEDLDNDIIVRNIDKAIVSVQKPLD